MAWSTIDLAGEVDDDRNDVELVLKIISRARETEGHGHTRVLRENKYRITEGF